MSDHYKILWEGGQGELVEKKIPFYRHHRAGRNRGGGSGFYRADAEEVLGCQTQLLCLLHR